MLKSIKIIREKYRILNQLKRARARNQTSLSINCYYLTKLPDLGTFNELRSMNIWDDSLTTLNSVGEVPKLKSLMVLGNGLSRLSALDTLPHLQALNIWDDALTSLPDLDALTQLQTLSIEGNSLTGLPELNRLKQLRFLTLEGTSFASLPDLDKLSHLQSLTIGSNAISQLPELKTLTLLQSLSIWGDKLASLPGLDTLSQLRELSIECRKLTRLTSLPLHDNLRIHIGDTPLIDPPRSAFETGLHALRKYYCDRERIWLWFAGRWNMFLKKPVTLAWLQTILASGIAAGLLLNVTSWLMFTALVPLFLLRTRYSMQLGLSWFNKIVGRKYLHHTSHVNIFFKAVTIGLVSIPLRFTAAITGFIRHPNKALRALPINWRYQISQADITTRPEIMPGSELVYCSKPHTTVTISRLWRLLTGQEIYPLQHELHDEVEDHDHHQARKRKNKFLSAGYMVPRVQAVIGLAPFFIVSSIFRIILQSSALIYWPMLFWNSNGGGKRSILKECAIRHQQEFLKAVLRILGGLIFFVYLSFLILATISPDTFSSIMRLWTGTGMSNYQPYTDILYFHIAVLGASISPIPIYYLADNLLNKKDQPHEEFKWFVFNFITTLQNIFILVVIVYGYEWVIKTLLAAYQ